MRFIHIADVHLGAQPDAGPLYSGKRPQELWDTLERVLGVCEEEKTDLLLIAGDLFHRQPLLRELREADYLFSQLTHTKVVLIAGNHDYIRKDSAYLTFRWSENIYPLFGAELEYVDFPDLRTAVYGMSYHTREISDPVCDGLKACGAEPFEILLAHGGDEKHIPFDTRALEKQGFDYIALGHIHKPRILREEYMIYPGALEPVDKNDTGPHGYVRGKIDESGVRTQWIPFALREYVRLEIRTEPGDTAGSIRKRIEEKTSGYGEQNIYRIILKGKRDPHTVFDVNRMTGKANILEISDETSPAYDLRRLYHENEDTVLGRFMEQFAGCEEGSTEYQALCEGVDALMKSME